MPSVSPGRRLWDRVAPSLQPRAQAVVHVKDADRPSSLSSASTTKSTVIFFSFMKARASAASWHGAAILGSRVITSPIVAVQQIAASMWREIAVGDDADQRALLVDHADAAERCCRHTISASRIGASSATSGNFVALVHQVGDADQRLAERSRRDGSCDTGRREKPRRSISATASASPSTSISVVEVVGARPIGQASRALGSTSGTSAACSSAESGSARHADQRNRKRLA